MKYSFKVSVIFLTLSCFILNSCSTVSLVKKSYKEKCSSVKYIANSLPNYISNRFIKGSPVRMGIIPFCATANFANQWQNKPFVGFTTAASLRNYMLQNGVPSIIELLNREDWPRKYEDFWSGNFTAMEMARNAGYDMLLVGCFDDLSSFNSISLYVKIIDVDNGFTVWYGKVNLTSYNDDLNKLKAQFGITKRRPDLIVNSNIFNQLAQCASKTILEDE